jgi:hypothetical protein
MSRNLNESAMPPLGMFPFPNPVFQYLVTQELEKVACGACGQFFRIEDILAQKSCTFVMIADLCGDFDLF